MFTCLIAIDDDHCFMNEYTFACDLKTNEDLFLAFIFISVWIKTNVVANIQSELINLLMNTSDDVLESINLIVSSNFQTVGYFTSKRLNEFVDKRCV